MNNKTTKRALLSSVIALLLCFSMFVGTTFAWFTDTASSASNKIVSGNLKVDLEVLGDNGWESVRDMTDPIFNYENWEPGYVQVKVLRVVNEGNLALKWQARLLSASPLSELAEVIEVYAKEDVTEYPADRSDISDWTYLGTLASFIENVSTTTVGEILPNDTKDAYESIGLAFKMQESADNHYQGMTLGAFDIQIVATQLAAETDGLNNNEYDKNAEFPAQVDTWDGRSVSIEWFLADPDADTFTLSGAADLVGLARLLDGTANIPSTVADELVNYDFSFTDKEIILTSDVDLYAEDANGEPICFDPIGSYRFDQIFSGTFDGQGHTISNMYQNTWALNNGYYYSDCGLGFFGYLKDATVKNVNFDNASISGESALCGIVAAAAYGNTVFENITVTNSECADYQYYAGGIVGWAAGTPQFINCTVDASTSIAAQWGDFDNSIGGIIGGCSGSAQILMKDCTVACRIDAYNDVTSTYQWYAYRRAGMLIGNTGKTTTVDGTNYAAAPQLTCENVTVIYEDWANYTYCEFAGTSWPYVRVQEGVSNSGYSNPRYGHPTDAAGNTVIDDTHVHNVGEDHFILCDFNQLYGGGQGVYGTATHEGVTVIYNNK